MASNWTTDTFQHEFLTVVHEHWGNYSLSQLGETDYLVGKITVVNTSKKGYISDAQLIGDHDDTSIQWSVVFVDSDGGNPTSNPVFKVGNLAPGEKSTPIKYWWRPNYIGGGKGDNFTVNIRLIPEFKIRFQLADADSSNISVSVDRIKEQY
ncbi:uncharacterized protein VTP21DRAFT_11534 [Calcarisporiella thermophila]|uniref:uncharacterized protein n=1 Tax=Calcarisporiella thermophila TaxID=911321 RepID=UPI00374436E8